MNLPRSAAASGTPAFPDTLAGELAAYLRRLPTERACEAGGMPDRSAATQGVNP